MRWGCGTNGMAVPQVSMVMDKFEQQFEDLDVQTQTMENAMASSTVMTTPSDQVESLIEQVAVQNGMGVAFLSMRQDWVRMLLLTRMSKTRHAPEHRTSQVWRRTSSSLQCRPAQHRPPSATRTS